MPSKIDLIPADSTLHHFPRKTTRFLIKVVTVRFLISDPAVRELFQAIALAGAHCAGQCCGAGPL